MPAEIVVMEDCASLFGVFEVPGSKPGVTYEVALHGESGVYCTCPAFKFSNGGDCKHVRLVFEKGCLGNGQWRDPRPDPELRPVRHTYDAYTGGTCECGEKLVAVRRAV